MAFPKVLLSFLFTCGLCAAASPRVLCGQFDTHTAAQSQNVFSTNEWGADGSGAQCISIATDDTAFNSTWKWTKNQDSVHAFPNVKLHSDQLPVQLSNISSLNLAVSWSMAPTSSSDSLPGIEASADVVFDMFLDPSATKSSSTTKPKYEVMVWIGQFGWANAIGSNTTKSLPTYKLNGTDFTLYQGPNGNGQEVFSWLASDNITTFNEDISPLLNYLGVHNLIPNSTYLGIVQFGTETFHATSNVTFTAQDFSLKLVKGVKKTSLASGVLPNLALTLFLGTCGIMALL